jgi:hypothetical protein
MIGSKPLYLAESVRFLSLVSIVSQRHFEVFADQPQKTRPNFTSDYDEISSFADSIASARRQHSPLGS